MDPNKAPNNRKALQHELEKLAPNLARLKKTAAAETADGQEMVRLQQLVMAKISEDSAINTPVRSIWQRSWMAAAVMFGVLIGGWFLLKPVQEKCETVECILAQLDENDWDQLQDEFAAGFDVYTTVQTLGLKESDLSDDAELLIDEIDLSGIEDSDLESLLGL